ncbi:MAG: hypothetical protein HYV46_18495 [candidate division NC10 bacterium]|nr:hypothetical protein [candidate division NC10 bacterium]
MKTRYPPKVCGSPYFPSKGAATRSPVGIWAIPITAEMAQVTRTVASRRRTWRSSRT